MRNRFLVIISILCMLLCGCGRLFPGSTDGSGPVSSDTLIRIGNDTCRVYEAMIFISSQREFYEGGYGPDIWNVRLDSSEFDEYLMDGNERKVSPLNIPAGKWQIEFHVFGQRTKVDIHILCRNEETSDKTARAALLNL